MTDETGPTIAELTSLLVANYVGNNTVAVSDLPALIRQVHASLDGLGKEPVAAPALKVGPAVSVKKSLASPDFILSLEDGRPYRMLKRHLAKLGMSPEDYRRKWGLPNDYPMTGPSYSQRRSTFAKSIGLGKVAGKRKPGRPKKA